MKVMKWIPIFALAAGPVAGLASETQLPVDIFNRLRIEFDDNVGSAASGEQDSMKIIEELELLLDTEFNATYLGVRYSPSFVYYDDREGDDNDLHHQLDFIVDHRISPTTTIRFKDTLRQTENPEVITDGTVVRNQNDFLYNSANLTVDHVISEKTTLRADGRYAFVAYEDDAVADISDYELAVAGLGVEQQLNPNTRVGVQTRYADYSFEDGVRDVESIQLGANASHVFSPTLQGNVRAGVESRDADAARESESEFPYVEGSIVVVPSKDTRVTVGAGYSKDRSPSTLFTGQERLKLHASVTQSLTPALRLTLSGAYVDGSFDADDATRDDVSGGDETTTRLGATVSYQLNLSNWIEAAWQYVDLESDVRPGADYERNRLSLGWKAKL